MAVARAISGSLSVKDRWILAAFGTTAAGLSLAGSAFIVLCYILFKELRKFSFKLVFFLALSDMLCSFFSLVGEPSNGLFCYAQDYSAHFFCIASFLWTTTIAFTLHRTVVKHKTDVEDFGSIFHLYVWGTSFAMTVIRSIGSDYGPIGAWCWTGSGKKEKVVHLITFYTPLWGAILYNGFTYYQVNRMLSNATRIALTGLTQGQEGRVCSILLLTDSTHQCARQLLKDWIYTYPRSSKGCFLRRVKVSNKTRN
ncbi:G-protein coupled receptor 1 isoform X3 [Phalaenopsis equestris]|uniref:G-protein coupled receptor 1 isoform X3 n=1 Tax=Phalaenopsis equestris TaxID=78828 RepID=UPI0009E3000C|nr:G-protein coupled receptor 1 isoform X3 [Phalaenopsis equestris]